LNVTLIVHTPPPPDKVPQVLVWENCRAPPLSVMLVMGSAAAPVFVTVTTSGPLATLNGSAPKANEVDDTV
jgi:hypothetical protein